MDYSKYLISEEEVKKVRAVKGKLNKALKTLNIPVSDPRKGGQEGSWEISFNNLPGTSTDSDDWKELIVIYLYKGNPPNVEIETVELGTSKRGRSDSNLLAKRTMKIKTEDDIEKVVKYVRNMAKKHYKAKI